MKTNTHCDSDTNPDSDHTSPTEDTLNWESVLFASWFPGFLQWLYFDFFNSLLLKPLGVTKERFTCICGTETIYWPSLASVGPGVLSDHCSNDLCPMVHRCQPDERASVLEPRNFIQCRECGDVECEQGYYLRQVPVEKELRRNKWIPDWEEWSDQLGRSTSATSVSDYHRIVPCKKPNDLSSVEVLETLCMECWLESLGAAPDRLRREARERETSEQLPYHHEKHQVRKRKRRRRWLRLSMLPVGILSSLYVNAAGAVLGVGQKVTLSALLPLSEMATLSPLIAILSVVDLLSFVLSVVGMMFWFYWLFWKSIMMQAFRLNG